MMKRVLIWLIRLYQRYLSPRKGRSTCIYIPTCSKYALEALEIIVKGNINILITNVKITIHIAIL